MRKKIYCVRDNVANEVVGGLIMDASDAPAIRAFYDALWTNGSLLAQHPADFDLLIIGEIDTATGLIDSIIPTTIATGNGWQEMQKGLGQ